MNKLIVATLKVVAITFLTLSCPYSGLSHTNPVASSDYVASAPKFSKQEIKNRLDNISSVIDLRYTEEVGRRIKEYTVSYRIAGEKILGKIDLYFPLFEAEISKRNLPEVLKYVAVVESHLDISAKSRSGAVGLWQFMKSTAEMQGLVVNKHIDERKDPEKSTQAALEYLSDMYDKFGDWTLAIAAYNCGPGGVRKAIRRSGSKEYWELRSFLPKETQKYVPRIIAAMYLMQYYHAHELSPRKVDRDLKHVMTITDGKGHNFSTLSKELDLENEILVALNTKYIKGQFPKNSGHLELIIPISRHEKYLELHDHDAYKKLLMQKKEKELRIRKEELLALRPQIVIQTIPGLIYRKIRPQKREKKYYKMQFS